MSQFVTRLRVLLLTPPRNVPATVTAGTTQIVDGTRALRASIRPDGSHRRWAQPLASRLVALRRVDDAEPPIAQPPAGSGTWSWQDAEGLDKPLAYSR